MSKCKAVLDSARVTGIRVRPRSASAPPKPNTDTTASTPKTAPAAK